MQGQAFSPLKRTGYIGPGIQAKSKAIVSPTWRHLGTGIRLKCLNISQALLTP